MEQNGASHSSNKVDPLNETLILEWVHLTHDLVAHDSTMPEKRKALLLKTATLMTHRMAALPTERAIRVYAQTIIPSGFQDDERLFFNICTFENQLRAFVKFRKELLYRVIGNRPSWLRSRSPLQLKLLTRVFELWPQESPTSVEFADELLYQFTPGKGSSKCGTSGLVSEELVRRLAICMGIHEEKSDKGTVYPDILIKAQRLRALTDSAGASNTLPRSMTHGRLYTCPYRIIHKKDRPFQERIIEDGQQRISLTI